MALLLVAGGGTTVRAQQEETRGDPDVQCSLCHGDMEFLTDKRATPAGDSALFVTDTVVDPSVHGALSCATCHPAHAEGYPHRADRPALACAECHAVAGREWGRSIHAANVAVEGDAASCVECHGTHRVFSANDRRSTAHPLNVAETCARCHADPVIVGEYFATPEEAQARRAVSLYYETVHGTAITESGLTVSATCNDCHGAHAVLPADSGGSSVNPAHIPETCGQCHVGIVEVYEQSAHGVSPRRADGVSPPVCTDCHTSHEIVETEEPIWFLGVVEECGACHGELYERYLETYHGKVTRLGSGLAAQCSECHTAHHMLPASDPESSVHPDNLVGTCAQCHEAANENFIRYYAHGDHTNREEYPKLYWPWLFMTTLLVGVFGFFGVHTALWLGRVSIDSLRRGRTNRDGVSARKTGEAAGHDEEDRT